MTVKLKANQIKQTRLELLDKQLHTCAVCHLEVTEAEAVLDHCHKGGHIRAVLHRGCNSLLGRVENNAPRYGLNKERVIAFLTGASRYLDLHRTNQTDLIHPSHFTPIEKTERKKKKAKRIKAEALKASQRASDKPTS